MQLASDFGLEIYVLPRESIFQLGNLAISRGIFDRKRNLISNLVEKLQIIVCESALPRTSNAQHPQDVLPTAQGKIADRTDRFAGHRIGGNLLLSEVDRVPG